MTIGEARDKIEKGEAGEYEDIPVEYGQLAVYFYLLANDIRNTCWPIGYRTKAGQLADRAKNLSVRFRKIGGQLSTAEAVGLQFQERE